MKFKTKLFFLSVALMAGTFVSAAVLAQWNNDPLAGNEAGPINATSLGTNIDSASLERGPGATVVAYQDTFAMRNRDAASLADAISNDRYFVIGLTADSGYQFDLEDIFLRVEANNISDGASFALMSNVTGFTAGDEIYSVDLYDGGSGPGQFSTHTVDLSSASFQGLSTVDFRVYSWGASSAFNAFAIGRGFFNNGTDDVVINGTVSVIPEPSTLALFGIALGSLLFFRRRKS